MKRVPARVLLASVVLFVGVAGGVGAQRTGNAISDLFPTTVILDDIAMHDAHFADPTQQQRLLQITGAINSAVASQLTTFPLGSPGGGLTFVFDEATGTVERATETFGSLFAERARTVGKGQWNIGFSYLTLSFDKLDDFGLENDELVFQLRHLDEDRFDAGLLFPFWEGDLITATVSVDELSTQTAVLFATYGISDRFDLSVAVPAVSVELESRGTLSISRLSTEGSNSADIHQFDPAAFEANLNANVATSYVDLNGDGTLDRAITRTGGDSSGIGDLLLRGKYRVKPTAQGGLALAFDLRLPTGDEDELLGTGATQAKLLLIGSKEYRRFAPHFNVGYTLSEGGDLNIPDEFNLTLGTELQAGRKVTLAADVIGRRLFDATTVGVNATTFEFRPRTNTGPPASTQLPDMVVGTDDLDLWVGAAGFRWNATGNLLLSGSVLASFSSDGLQDDDPAFVLSLDYSPRRN